MNKRLHYFAYGSNMAGQRLMARIPSAKFVCIAELIKHVLKFHKPSNKDGSGKCDAAYSGNEDDRVYGAVFSIHESELAQLDKFEGKGYGYERITVTVFNNRFGDIQAQTLIRLYAHLIGTKSTLFVEPKP
jgi:gamma-glutamylcyclotransferase